MARMVASMAIRPTLSITESRIGPRSERRPTMRERSSAARLGHIRATDSGPASGRAFCAASVANVDIPRCVGCCRCTPCMPCTAQGTGYNWGGGHICGYWDRLGACGSETIQSGSVASAVIANLDRGCGDRTTVVTRRPGGQGQLMGAKRAACTPRRCGTVCTRIGRVLKIALALCPESATLFWPVRAPMGHPSRAPLEEPSNH